MFLASGVFPSPCSPYTSRDGRCRPRRGVAASWALATESDSQVTAAYSVADYGQHWANNGRIWLDGGGHSFGREDVNAR